MKNAIEIVISAVIFGAFAYGLSASPAATQTWVKNYVGTNTTATASYSNAVSRATINAMGIMQSAIKTLAASGSVEQAVQQSRAEATAVVGPLMDLSVGF